MERLRRDLVVAVVAAVMVSVSAGRAAAQAQAQDSATVQPAGPQMAPNGKNFTDIIGRGNNPTFNVPSFVIVEFGAGDLGLSGVSQVSSVSIALTQTLFAATSRGPMKVYLTTDTTTDIQFSDTNPQVIFDQTDVAGLGTQLATLYVLGNAEFLPVRNGWVDTFTYSIDSGSPAETYLIGQINNGGTIRLVVAPDMDDVDMELVGGSYAGAGNSAQAFWPVLSVTAQ